MLAKEQERRRVIHSLETMETASRECCIFQQKQKYKKKEVLVILLLFTASMYRQKEFVSPTGPSTKTNIVAVNFIVRGRFLVPSLLRQFEFYLRF